MTCALAAAALSACGGGSKTSSSQLSAVQYQNYQRISGYTKAVHQIVSEPAAAPTSFAKAVSNLRTAIGELSSLHPPQQLRAAHENVLRGFRGELATSLALEAGQKSHSAVAISHARHENRAAEQVALRGLAEDASEMRKCAQDRFSC
jgi:conjugal transfer/entry exclusion protein